MSEYLSADEFFGDLPPAERLALDQEAMMISQPPRLFGAIDHNQHARGHDKVSHVDISD